MISCLFVTYSFRTHRRFINLRNFTTQAVLVSNNAMKTDLYTKIDHMVRIEICLSNDSKALHYLLGTHSFHTHQPFVNLRNFMTKVMLVNF